MRQLNLVAVAKATPLTGFPTLATPLTARPAAAELREGPGREKARRSRRNFGFCDFFILIWEGNGLFFPFTWHTPGSHLHTVAEQVPPPLGEAAAFRSAVEEK